MDGASLLVACYEVPFLDVVGLHVPYFIVLREGGREVPTSSACTGGHAIYADYDPMDPYGSGTDASCGDETSDGGPGTWPGPGGTTCHSEYIYVDISYNGGQT